MNIKARWLRIEEHSNALNYLEMVKYFLSMTTSDIYYWKWVILSLHGAIYGFAVSAIRGTNSGSVVVKTKKGDRLISFHEALSRCQELSWIRYAMLNSSLVLNDSQKKSIGIMKNVFRNEFVHFKSKGWSIEIHDFPLITMDCLDVIRFLGIQTYSGYRMNQYKQRKIKSLVFQSKKIIKKSTLFKEAKHAL